MSIATFKRGKFALWLAHHVVRPLAEITWCPLKSLFNHGIYWDLTEQDHEDLRRLLRDDYYIILTRHNCHLSTLFIGICSRLVGDKNGYWAHALMNVDDETDHTKFAFMEATGAGMHRSSFMQVFDCDSAVLLKPKRMQIEDFTAAITAYVAEQGKEYDDFGDMAQDKAVNCVESVRCALLKITGYAVKFAEFEALIQTHAGELTPSMFYGCLDFEIVWERRKGVIFRASDIKVGGYFCRGPNTPI